MKESESNNCIFPISIPEESRFLLEKARAVWVKKHVDQDMDGWESRNPRPGYNDNPIAIDRYEEMYHRLALESEKKWCDKFDMDILPRGIEDFVNRTVSEK